MSEIEKNAKLVLQIVTWDGKTKKTLERVIVGKDNIALALEEGGIFDNELEEFLNANA